MPSIQRKSCLAQFQNYTKVLFFLFLTIGSSAKSRSVEYDEIADKMISSKDL